MPYTKTAVSIESSVFESAEALARELHVTRSDLYTRALKELLRQRKIRRIQEQIDAAAHDLTDDAGARERISIAEMLHQAASATMRGAIERGESTW